MRSFVLASLGLAVSSFAQDPVDQGKSFRSKSAYQEFLAEQGGTWVAQWTPATLTPRAIYGTGLPLDDWRGNSLEEARRHALLALGKHRTLLGLGTSEFRESIGARMGRTWSFKFDQYFRGLPCIGGRADVRVNMKGVIAMLGSQAWPIPADFDTVPAVAEQVAKAIAWAEAGTPTGVPQPSKVAEPRLVVWGDIAAADEAPFFLAWEVAVSNVDAQGNGPVGRYYVDARTGRVLHWQSDKHECGFAACTDRSHTAAATAGAPSGSALLPVPTVVTVLGWTRTGNDAYSALVNAPMRGLVLSVPGIGNVTTDLNGQFTIDIAAPVNIAVGALDGRHNNPISGANGPSGNFTVNPGVNSTIQLLTAAATTNEAAHTTTQYWVDVTNEYCRAILGNSAQLNTASSITTTINIASTCNAYYTGNSINFYQAGGGCANTAFSTVISHEWGHGLDDRYGGISNATGDGLSEGWGDIMGMYIVDSPLLGSGFQTAGVALRRGDNTLNYPQTGAGVHTAGQVWMGFAWRLRERLRTAFGTTQALAISNDIVISSIVADATTQADAVREVFVADDDDGNLANGTPNYAQLSGAATDKNLPFPAIQVAAVTHTPLANTSVRLTPRIVNCTAAAVSSGSITDVRLVFNTGGGNVTRTMVPNGATNGYRAMLPGIVSGSVSYYIEAVHSGGTTVRTPASGAYSYVVSVPPSGPFTGFLLENFDAGAAGWTTGRTSGITANDWQLGAPAGKSGTVSGVAWSDPAVASSGTGIYGTDLGAGTSNGRYPNSMNYWLRSPVVNCTGRTGVTLRFRRWLTVEEGIYDQASIFVNGIQVWQNPQNGNLVDTGWNTFELAIPAADNNPAVQVEFRLVTDGGLNLGGWQIDDFELGTRFTTPLAAELRMTPEQAAQAATITIAIKTDGGPKPFYLVLGDTAGPTVFPGVPPILVGGTGFIALPGTSDASGNYGVPFGAPPVASATGLLWYSQVLTLDASNTNIVTSNQWLNLFTQ